VTVPKPWMLPLIVVALIAPIAIGLAVFGPQGMVFAAFLVGVALVVVVSRPRRGRPIEVAAGDDGRHHVLVAATAAIDEPGLAESISRHVERERGERDVDVLILAPALNARLDKLAVDVADARAAAARRLETSLNRLRSAGLEARGSVGDSNPMLAIEDALREFPADEVIVVAGDETEDELTSELRQRLDRPVEALTTDAGT
jgi:hypothetical protein